MKRFWERAFATAAGAAIAGSLFPACAHDDATMFIHGVQAPPTTSSTGGSCLYTADPTQPELSHGVVDAALVQSYAPFVLVGNQLIPQAAADQVRAETARVTVQGAFVKVVDPVDGSVVMDNTVLTSGSIAPGTGATPSYANFEVTMLNAAAVAHFDPGSVGAPARVAIAYVKVYGQTLGGTSVETNEFQFPINVCHGCLVSAPAGVSAATYCSGQTAAPSSNVIVPCAVGWDQPVDCTLCYPNPVCAPK